LRCPIKGLGFSPGVLIDQFARKKEAREWSSAFALSAIFKGSICDGRCTSRSGPKFDSKDYISDPKNKAKSVVLTEEGERLSRELFGKYFSAKR
jgi:hypothetical protein